MCTAVSYGGCFGRNLDVDREYGEQLVLMPRNFSFPLRRAAAPERHYAVAGMARVEGGVPLYFDGMNEKGLAMAGLAAWLVLNAVKDVLDRAARVEALKASKAEKALEEWMATFREEHARRIVAEQRAEQERQLREQIAKGANNA